MREYWFGKQSEQQSLSQFFGRIVWQRRLASCDVTLNCEFFEFRFREAGESECFFHYTPPFNRLFIVMRDTLMLEVARKEYSFRRGDAVLLPAQLPFHAYYPASFEMFYLHFSLTDQVGHPLFSTQKKPLTGPPVAPELLTRLTETENADEFPTLQNALWDLICRRIDAKEWEILKAHCRVPETLRQLFPLLETLPPAAVRIKELAGELNVSPERLSRVFRNEYGRSLKSFLEERLAQQSLRMLSLQPLSIAAAAEQLGFSDVKYFHRFFQRRFGVTPGRWRKNGNQKQFLRKAET